MEGIHEMLMLIRQNEKVCKSGCQSSVAKKLGEVNQSITIAMVRLAGALR